MVQHSRALLLAALCGVFLLSASPAAALFFGKEAPAPGDDGAPIVQNLSVETYRDVAYTGTLSAVDNEGDSFTFAIVSEPSRGTVTILEDGVSFLYTPQKGKSGEDTFTYTATDQAGNVSAPATVTVKVLRQKTAVSYADLAGHPAAADAVCLAEHGVYVGEQVGNTWFFSPEEVLSRSGFLAMAMTAAGYEADPTVTLTGFSDDHAIDAWAKSYAAAAVRDGVVNGIATETGVQFKGSDAITLPEAAAILDRLFPVTDVAVTDSAQPVWAAQAVANLSSVDVLKETDSKEPVTRGDAAEMLSELLRLQEDKESGLFSLFS